jgi:pimeloyl-ACP methyl ester carboxylesterase
MLRLALALSLSLLAAAPAAAASVGDIEIHSTVQGNGPKTIVFVHGWTCDASSWDGQVPEFAKGYRVVTLDLPGHGQSEAPGADAFSMKLFADAVEAVRAEVGAGKIVLVGHSMGAAVIRQYAFDHPDRVAGLVAVDGPLDMRPMAAFPGFGPLTLDTRKTVIESMFVPGTTYPLRTHILGMMLASPEATAKGAMNAMLDPKNQSDRKITAPALSIFAGTSNFADDGAILELLPNHKSEKFAGTGHFLMMEDPARFNAALKAFLDQRARF